MGISTQQKTIKRGYRQTEVGVIPEDWDVVFMDSVAKRGSGHTPDKQHPEYWGGDIKWISLKDSDRLDVLYICDTAATITPAGIANSSAIMHPAGTVVLSRDAGVGKSAIMRDAMAVSQHFMAWLCGPRLDNHFLYYWLQSKKSEFERIAFGNTIKTIGLPYFKKLKIPLPPLHEQQMVAAALSAVGALISELDQLIAKKRDIKTAAMQQLLTAKRRLPGFSGEWEVESIFALAERKKELFDDGDWIEAEFLTTSGVRLVQTGNIGEGQFIDKESKKYISAESYQKLGCKEVKPGDILICRLAEPAGRACVLPDIHEDKVITAVDVTIFRPVESVANRNYLVNIFSTPAWFEAVNERCGGTTRSRIARGELAKIKVNVPPLPEQTAIATFLSDMDADIAALGARRDKTSAIKQGMMQQLLTGNIRLI